MRAMSGNGSIPKPQRRLFGTRFKRPRNLRRFAPRITFEGVQSQLADRGDVANWGQVVLLNDAVVALHRDGTVSRLFHTITALYGDQDLAEWDEVVREYDQRNSRETIRRACVHLPDGTSRTAQKVSALIDEHTRAIHLTFFPLRPGIVLELEEQFDRFTPYELAPGAWSQMFLQGPAPRMRTRLTIAVAEPFSAAIQIHHCDWQPDESRQEGYHVFRWDLQDLPGIELDAWSPPPRDFVPWVDFTTLSSWEPVARYFVNELTPKQPPPAELCRHTTTLTDGSQSNRDKVADVYRYASGDLRYGRHPREVDLETPRHPSQMLEDLRGDCKDKAALMTSMLGHLGIRSNIALIQSRANGQTPSLPAPWFDHALLRVQLDDSVLWLDPAGGPCTFGDLPYNDQGTNALLLDADNAAGQCSIPEANPGEHKYERLCRGELAADGTYCFCGRVTASGEPAVELRLQYLQRTSEQRHSLLAQQASADVPGGVVTRTEFLRLDDLRQDVAFEIEMTIADGARVVKDLLLFRVPWSQMPAPGPLAGCRRRVPLSAPNAGTRFERHEIEIPSGYQAYGLPSVSSECDWGRYDCRARIEESTLICERETVFTGGIVPSEKYLDFKRFWDTCQRGDTADVVLIGEA